MQLTDNDKSLIRAHALEEFPNECCGVILLVNGHQEVRKCRNVSPEPKNSFVINNADIANVNIKDIVGFYHSHEQNLDFSLADIYFAERLQKNCVLFVKDSFKIYSPVGMEIPYVNRPFFVGHLDCFTLFKDYYRRELNITLPEHAHAERYSQNDWKTLAESADYQNNTILFDYFKENGFVEVQDIRKHDVLLLKLPFTKTFPLHIGVMIEKDKILHHLLEFSSMESYNNRYKRLTTNILRHSSLL